LWAGLYRSGSALSQLYGTEATLEHHHFNHAVMILNSEVNNIASRSVTYLFRLVDFNYFSLLIIAEQEARLSLG